MRGIKLCLFGIAVVLTGGFIVIIDKTSLSGLGAVLFISGITLCIVGCAIKD